jgi:membrane protein YdbS with pleckstrin-like domain
MASPTPTRTMPRLLKATYLADQEYLLEETRATKLYYFPGPIVWVVLFGILSYVGWSAWMGHPVVGALTTLSTTIWRYLTYALLFLVLVGLLWLLVRYFRWIRTVYAVSSRRVIVQKGILGRNFDEIPVTQIRGVDVHQSFGQRILGYGTVRVSSEGGSRVGNEDWKGIPKPFRFQKLIENATQTAMSPPPQYPPPQYAAPVYAAPPAQYPPPAPPYPPQPPR